MDRSAALTGAVVVAAALGCAYLLVRTTQPVVHDSADGGDPMTAADPPSRPLGAQAETLAPARCVELAPAVPLDGVAPGALDWGDGVFDARGLVAAGIVRSKPGERAASVVTFAMGEGSGKPVVIDLGRASGDDPAPRPFVLGASLYAARVETAHDKRRLVVSELGAIDASGALAAGSAPKEAASFPQGSDESLAYDLAPSGAHAFVAWDDDELGHGVIRAARFGEADAGGAPVVISPKSTDAEAPRLVEDGAGGAWVAWIARKAELDAGAADLAAHNVETPAEAREERWVEVAHLDASGAVVGAPVRLAPGRVSDFDLHREAAAPASVVVVMRDEEGTLEARGARLVRQIVRAEGTTLQAGGVGVLVGEGVGSADPIVVDDGAAGLVAYADLAERPRISPLAPAATADARDAGAPSLELGLEGGRVLASRPLASVARAAGLAAKIKRAADRGAAVFAAGSKQDRAEARILLCER